MALQGVLVAVHDIDIQTDRDDAYEIERRLAEYVTIPVRYVASKGLCSHLGALEIAGVRVEVMGAIQKRLPDLSLESPVDIEPHRCRLNAYGMRLPALSLAYEYQAYLQLDRLERAELLRRWLQDRGIG